MKVTFRVNLGMVDAKRLGLEKKLQECKAGNTVDVDKGVGEKLIDEGHAVAEGEEDQIVLSAQGVPDEEIPGAFTLSQPQIKGVSKSATVKGVKEEGDDAETSEVANLTVTEAADKISRMRSKEHLQSIADTDKRQGVTEAAKKRLAELG